MGSPAIFNIYLMYKRVVLAGDFTFLKILGELSENEALFYDRIIFIKMSFLYVAIFGVSLYNWNSQKLDLQLWPER